MNVTPGGHLDMCRLAEYIEWHSAPLAVPKVLRSCSHGPPPSHRMA